MSPLPERCPTCGTQVPPGAARCPGCGRVFGEDNRCPHCHAIAAVRPDGDGYVCVACGKPRTRKPLTTVLGEEPGRASLVPRPVSMRGRALRTAGTASVAAAIAGAALATVVLGTGVVGIATAAAVGAVFVLLGLRFFRRASGVDEEARALDQKTAAAKVHGAAARLGGDVTAAQVAEQLGVSVEEADRALTAMADGTKVTVEVDTDTGTVHYVFAEILAAKPKVRVAPSEPEAEEAAAKEELEQRRSRI
jgi:hypothetical protein